MGITTKAEFEAYLKNMGPRFNMEFQDGLNDVPSIRGQIFTITNSDKAQEKFGDVTGLGALRVWTGERNYDKPEALWAKLIAPVTFHNAVAIERELIEDLEERIILDRTRDLGGSAEIGQEEYASLVLRHADDTTLTYDGQSFTNTTPDGVAICASNHPHSQTNATTQANYGTSAFTPDNLSTTFTAMRGFLNPLGRPALVMPDTLIYAPSIEVTVAKVLASMGMQGTANNDINVFNPSNRGSIFQKGLKTICWPWLDLDAGSAPWFLCDSRLMSRSLLWIQRLAPQFEEEYDFDSMTFKHGVRARWNHVCKDWRGIFGQFPA